MSIGPELEWLPKILTSFCGRMARCGWFQQPRSWVFRVGVTVGVTVRSADIRKAGTSVFEIITIYIFRLFVYTARFRRQHNSLRMPFPASSWADLVEELVPQAVASAVRTNKGLRSGLPQDYLDFMGVVHSDEVPRYRIPRDCRAIRCAPYNKTVYGREGVI